jgi:hypothetical protein
MSSSSINNYTIPYAELTGSMHCFASDDDAEESEDDSPVTTRQENSPTVNGNQFSELFERVSSEEQSLPKDFKDRNFTVHLQTQEIDDATLLKKLETIYGELSVLMDFSDYELKKYSLAQREELRSLIVTLSRQMYLIQDQTLITAYEIFYREIKERFSKASLRDYFSSLGVLAQAQIQSFKPTAV